MPKDLVEDEPQVKAWDEATPKSSPIKERGKYGLWRQVLSTYSNCDLTVPNDKLIAIAGLVTEFARLFDDEYVAGLWRKNLVNELLWQKMNYKKPHGKRPEEYRAPSWSWASLDMDVKFIQDDELDEKDYVKVLDVDVKPSRDGNDATAAVESATIRLRGYLVEIQKPTTAISGLNDINFDAEVDKNWTGDKHYFLPLRRWRWYWKEDLKAKKLVGIVLRAKLDNDSVVYERVGTLNLDVGYPLSYLDQAWKTKPGHVVKPLVSPTFGKHVEFEWIDEGTETFEFCIV
jgi:hypothetical protein